MKYLLVAPFFGMFGYLVAQAVYERTGCEVLAALLFGLTVAVMQWGGELRRRMDDKAV